MPVFNPGVQPTQDPNFAISRVVDPSTPLPVIQNNSTALAINTANQVAETGIPAVDAAFKKGIQNTIYKDVDPIRDQFTAGLEKVKASLDQGIIPAPVQAVAGSTSGKSLLDSNASADEDPDLPTGLDSGLSRIDQLAQAKAAGSPKLNDTMYAKDTLSVAKQLRTQYPGYREYIDEQVSKASGLPVANSYMQNMLVDINRQLNQTKAAKDDVLSSAMKNLDVPGMTDASGNGRGYLDLYKAGDPSMPASRLLGKIGEWQNLQAQQKVDAASRAEKTDNTKDQVLDQTKRLTRTLSDSVSFETSAIKDLGGVGTPQDLLRYFDDVAQGRHPEVSDAQVQQKKLMLNAWVAQVKTRMLSVASGYGGVVGSDVANQKVEEAMAPIYTMQKFVNSKEDGPAFFHAGQVEAIKNDDVHNWLVSKDKGALSRQMLVGRTVLGEQYFPDWIRNLLTAVGPDGKPLDNAVKDVFSQEGMSAVAPVTDTRGQPIPRYMKDALLHGKKVGIPEDSNYYGGVINLVTGLADPKMPATGKDQLIDWGFNPKNIGRLDELKQDYKDPNTGEWVPGKYRAFNILSSPGVIEGVKESAKVKPENYVKFQSTLEQEFGRLYKSDVQDLNKIMAKPYLNAHFSYDDQNHAFGLVDNNNRPITRNDRTNSTGGAYGQPNQVYLNGVLDTLEKVNGGIRSLANVQSNSPTGTKDTSQYLLQTLQTIGFRPGDNISGATQGMMKSIIKSQAPDMTADELNKLLLKSPGGVTPQRSNFAPDDNQGPTVNQFLQNPAGIQPKKVFNYSDEKLLGIDTKDIPEGMSAREFLDKLNRAKKYGTRSN